MNTHTASTGRKGVRPIRKLTTLFILLYILLVFIPTVTFIGIYSANLLRQQRNESRYNEQLLLSQSASFLGNTITQGEATIHSFQGENTLLNLLEGNFSSASEELLACITYVQPMMSSVLATYPYLTDIYVYRYDARFLTNSDMIFSLPMIDELPYDPALLNGTGASFLAPDPAAVRHQENDTLEASQYIYLLPIYNSSYTKVVGILEVQIDLDRALTMLDITQHEGSLFLAYEGRHYPITTHSGVTHLDWQNPVTSLAMPAGAQLLSEPIKGTEMAFAYRLESKAGPGWSIWQNVLLVTLLLLLPTSIVCLFIYRYMARLTRFGRHIRDTESKALTHYPEPPKGDELGEVFSAYNAMVDTIRDLIDQVRQAEQLKNSATYYAMSSQVNPHFMFNTLENIRMQIEIENYQEASQMLFVLGRFLRYNISLRRESVLSDELQHIEHYLMIYRYRVSSLIDFTIHQPEDLALEAVRCPFCMLQPIVENCLKHGIRDAETLRIDIVIETEGDDLLITVADNGSGMQKADIDALNASFLTPEIREQSTGSHVGLGNVNARLKFFYGSAYGLQLSSNEQEGLSIGIRISRVPAQDMLERV